MIGIDHGEGAHDERVVRSMVRGRERKRERERERERTRENEKEREREREIERERESDEGRQVLSHKHLLPFPIIDKQSSNYDAGTVFCPCQSKLVCRGYSNALFSYLMLTIGNFKLTSNFR